MKTAQQIIGLPVISISDGNEIGKVKNVIINAAKGTVDFFIIDSGVRSLAGGVIPAGRVLGIGEYALTIQEPDDISDIVKIPAAIELLQKNITVSGTRVLTKKGSLLGESGDIYINEEDETYAITGVEFVPSKSEIRSGIIPRSSIITFGKNLLVVNDDFLDTLLEAAHEVSPFAADEKKNFNSINSFESEPVLQKQDVPDETPENQTDNVSALSLDNVSDQLFKLDNDTDKTYEISPAAEGMPSDEIKMEEQAQPNTQSNETGMNAAELFEYRQKQYLLGKKVSKTIYNSSGGVIVTAGEIITDQIIEEVKQNGKLIDLVMNYEG